MGVDQPPSNTPALRRPHMSTLRSTPSTAPRRGTRSWFGISTGIVAAAALLGACSDATAPVSRPELAPSAAPSQAVYTVGDTTVTTFTYNPLYSREQTFAGAHNLSMPAGAVCDPLLSGYGAGTWDQGCVAALLPINFTAKAWRTPEGRPVVTFTPDVRFVPGKVVTLRLLDKKAAETGRGDIVWCPTGATTCVNESATDPSLAPTYHPSNGQVSRRLKHFSGYQIILGFSDDGSGGSY